jgi:hypothetical protein
VVEEANEEGSKLPQNAGYLQYIELHNTKSHNTLTFVSTDVKTSYIAN